MREQGSKNKSKVEQKMNKNNERMITMNRINTPLDKVMHTEIQ
jgi:hypothetical protein